MHETCCVHLPCRYQGHLSSCIVKLLSFAAVIWAGSTLAVESCHPGGLSFAITIDFSFYILLFITQLFSELLKWDPLGVFGMGCLHDGKMLNGFRYYRALERVSIASALSTALTIYPCQIRVHQRWQSKLQLPTARKKKWRPATVGSSPPCGYLSTLWYTLL